MSNHQLGNLKVMKDGEVAEHGLFTEKKARFEMRRCGEILQAGFKAFLNAFTADSNRSPVKMATGLI